jgi:hypothetical protein
MMRLVEIVMKADPGIWTGRALSALVIVFMLMDAGMKLAMIQPVIDTTGQLGWPTDAVHIRGLAITLLAATALYTYPRTAVLGAVLLTAYLGGAVATHVRIGSPLFSHVLFGVYLGVFVWGGLYLRDAKVRALFPLRARDA